MTKILINSKKYKFFEVADWIVEKMPKNDENFDRWRFEDEQLVVDNENMTSITVTYVIFKEERDAIMFSLRWS